MGISTLFSIHQAYNPTVWVSIANLLFAWRLICCGTLIALENSFLKRVLALIAVICSYLNLRFPTISTLILTCMQQQKYLPCN